VLETNGNRCEIFFTSYTLDGVEDPSERPVTFIFNGGPGSCSMYLHVGCFGPRRIDVDENGNAINLSFSYYQCGHMIYMEKQSFDKFRRDAEAWYK